MANRNPFGLNSECVNYYNTDQSLIHITEDKLRVILYEHKEKNKQFYSWTTPLGIFVSCLLATITSTFGNTWGIPASTWEAMFILCTVGTGIWSLGTGINAFRHRKGRATDDLIDTIKNNKANSSDA